MLFEVINRKTKLNRNPLQFRPNNQHRNRRETSNKNLSGPSLHQAQHVQSRNPKETSPNPRQRRRNVSRARLDLLARLRPPARFLTSI